MPSSPGQSSLPTPRRYPEATSLVVLIEGEGSGLSVIPEGHSDTTPYPAPRYFFDASTIPAKVHERRELSTELRGEFDVDYEDCRLLPWELLTWWASRPRAPDDL